jgi:uncharacterized glyoxalase superfamily protein PhnB
MPHLVALLRDSARAQKENSSSPVGMRSRRASWSRIRQRSSFLKRVFDANGDFESNAPSDITIGDSRLMISGAGEREKFPAFLYAYVADAEATAKQAVEAGAVLVEEAWDTPYGDRRAMAKDTWGNLWQIATYKTRQTPGKR